MITEIYLNYPLKRVPFNGLVVIGGIAYRRGYAHRSTHEIQLVRWYDALSPEIRFVSPSAIVQFYKES